MFTICNLYIEIILKCHVVHTSGEGGEVSEIFQWKGALEDHMLHHRNDPLPFTDKEISHIGEEISDVFIYTTRLSDVCGIDLSHAVLVIKSSGTFEGGLVAKRTSRSDPWLSFDFFDNNDAPLFDHRQYRSHRQIALEIQGQIGKVATIFANYSEEQTTEALPLWNDADVNQLSHALGSIIALLIILSKITNLSIGHVIGDKFSKNAAKYPVSLAKNSSAKYTTYLKPTDYFVKDFSKYAAVAAIFGLVGFSLGKSMK